MLCRSWHCSYKPWGSHYSVDEDSSLVGYDTVSLVTCSHCFLACFTLEDEGAMIFFKHYEQLIQWHNVMSQMTSFLCSILSYIWSEWKCNAVRDIYVGLHSYLIPFSLYCKIIFILRNLTRILTFRWRNCGGSPGINSFELALKNEICSLITEGLST